jgi:hypothetical protein
VREAFGRGLELQRNSPILRNRFQNDHGFFRQFGKVDEPSASEGCSDIDKTMTESRVRAVGGNCRLP